MADCLAAEVRRRSMRLHYVATAPQPFGLSIPHAQARDYRWRHPIDEHSVRIDAAEWNDDRTSRV
jgi:hypothetical protein